MALAEIGNVTAIPTSSVIAGDNDRRKFDQDELERLAKSLDEIGLAQPITVRPLGNDTFRIVAGERRFRAAMLNGWEAIPALIDSSMDDARESAVMLAENTGRVDLNPIEEAKAYRKRLDSGDTIADTAQIAGVTARRIERRLALLRLDDSVQDLIASGWLGTTNADQMVGLTPERQRIACRAIASDMTRAQVVATISELHRQQNEEPLFSFQNESYVQDLRDIAKSSAPRRDALLDMLRSAAAELAAAGLAAELVDRINRIEK